MFYSGKSVKVPTGINKGLNGILTNIAGCDTYFTVQKDDGVKVKIHYKDMLNIETKSERNVGELALLRKSINVDGKKQTFTLCEIIDKHTNNDVKSNHLGKIKVRTLNNTEIEVNCNAVLALA